VQWVATYTDFNGRRYDFGSSNSSIDSPYLRVKSITNSCLAFSAFPFSVDAGSDLSVIAANPKGASMVALLQSKFGVGANSLNPLTKDGFKSVKIFASRALATTVPTATVPNPANLGSLPPGVSGLVGYLPPQIVTPDSPQKRALNTLQTAATTSNDTM
jgi:hypothetical protein